MLPFRECPVCGGEVVSKEVEKLLRGGVNTAVVRVEAEVCLRCGERLYSKETISLFEQIRRKLAHQDVSEFDPLGRSFRVVPQVP
jgi:YgiT-type zinc finger domain-containing protein